MSSRGLFITVEGGEGVGKSTNITFIEQQLKSRGVDVQLTREPGGSALGEDIRHLLLELRNEPVVPMAELLLMFAARAQHISTRIEPALAAGVWVLCDRFTDATYAYQCGGRGIERRAVSALEQLVQGPLHPDCTVLLDAPVSIGLARARDRGGLDRFEQEEVEFFERVRATYLDLAENSSGRYRVIDASQSLENVQQQLLKVCIELTACWGVRRSAQ
jgi:dTMP kinase